MFGDQRSYDHGLYAVCCRRSACIALALKARIFAFTCLRDIDFLPK